MTLYEWERIATEHLVDETPIPLAVNAVISLEMLTAMPTKLSIEERNRQASYVLHALNHMANALALVRSGMQLANPGNPDIAAEIDRLIPDPWPTLAPVIAANGEKKTRPETIGPGQPKTAGDDTDKKLKVVGLSSLPAWLHDGRQIAVIIPLFQEEGSDFVTYYPMAPIEETPQLTVVPADWLDIALMV